MELELPDASSDEEPNRKTDKDDGLSEYVMAPPTT